MNEKQREATKIVLQQCSEGHLDAEEALTIIDSIVGEPPQVQYVPCPGGDPSIMDQFRVLGKQEGEI